MTAYAKDQPQGYNNFVENIAIVGAGGTIGVYIVEHLLKTGKHKVTAITRESSKSSLPAGVIVKKVNYDDQSSLVSALRGQDALIITMAATAAPEQSYKLIQAAAEAKVPWILPNEYGTDNSNPIVGKETFLGPVKEAIRDKIEALGLSWIGLACGFWYEFSLAGREDRYGFDFKTRSVTLFDNGTQRLPTSTFSQVGRAVAKLLSLKVLSDDENDNSVTLSQWHNKFVNIYSFNINQKEMLESVLRVTGETESDWNISHTTTKARFEKAAEEVKNGNRREYARMLYSRVFFPDTGYDTLPMDNDKLGLPTEDLDEATKRGIEWEKSGVFEGPYN